MIVCAKDGQSLVDLALMMTGATEGVWALALRNGVSVTWELGHGAAIAYESEDIEDARTASRYKAEGICPATEVSDKTLVWLMNELVVEKRPDYEMIETDEAVPQSTKAVRWGVFADEFEKTFM